MQPSDIGQIVTLGQPRLSPDGRTVAFVVTRVDLDANTYRSAVWLASTSGDTRPYQLTSGEHGDGNPAWAPDGRRLAFTSERVDDKTTLHVVPIGLPGETVTLCERDEAIEEPAWSPDGRRIAFASRERTRRWADGDDDRARPPRLITSTITRLDGVGWIVDRPRNIFVVDADGSRALQLVAGGPFEHGTPAWMPDGQSLVVPTTRDPDWDLTPVTRLFRVALDGGEAVPVTDATLSHNLPAPSPDGRFVATVTADELLVPTHGQIAVVDSATGGFRQLTTSLDRQCAPFPGARQPVWDDAGILFSLEDHGNVHIHRVHLDGTSELVVGGERQITGYDAGSGPLSGTVVFTAATPTTLAELYVRDPDGRERRLTDLGTAFTDAVPAVTPEHFTVPSPAGDGDVDAWAVLPDGDRLPVLLSIHGGPMTQYTNAWFDEFQLWAGAGYAVVYCNPHGSTGHTQEWTRSIRSPEAAQSPGTGWGGIDADDVLAVLDAALARYPRLDPERVGVLGGSYGGYLTSWLVGHTDRFAAACSERACNNLESLDRTSDVAGTFRFEMGVSPLDDPEPYRRMSPITYVRDIRTPLLIVHSEQDLRCHVEQADQLFVALRQLGRPVEYWRFPEESHGLSRAGAPRHRVQRAEIILDWFGRHLGGTRPEIGWDHPSSVRRSRGSS